MHQQREMIIEFPFPPLSLVWTDMRVFFLCVPLYDDSGLGTIIGLYDMSCEFAATLMELKPLS